MVLIDQVYNFAEVGAGAPPPLTPIIFERRKLPKQIIYRWKGNLSESRNHFKYQKNILISRFHEQFSRNDSPMATEWLSEKKFRLLERKHIIYHFEAGDLEIPNI